MFHRGQRIIVKESSAKKRAHPNVGDIGYMGSAFLFYRERFMLIDAEFFSYPGYVLGERKSEHKLFIIDLGMVPSFKRRLITQGYSREWFVRNKFVVNLNPIDTNSSISQHWHDKPGLPSLWPHIYEYAFNRSNHSKLADSMKIHVGQIGLLRSGKYKVNDIGDNNMKAWIRVMSPFLNASYRAAGEIREAGDVKEKIYRLHQEIQTCLHLKKEYGVVQILLFELDKSTVRSPQAESIIVKTIKQIQAVLAMQRLKQEKFLISRHINEETKPFIAYHVKAEGIGKLINGYIKDRDSSDVWDILITILFRALIMQGNTHSRLSMIKDMLPFGDGWYENISKDIDKMKEKAINDSAALARIFDGKLIS